MPSTKSSTVNLQLPILPETKDPELFKALTGVYNALNLLAFALDTYTGNGDVGAMVDDSITSVTNSITAISRKTNEIKEILEEYTNLIASHFTLRKAYYGYTVPSFVSLGAVDFKTSLRVRGTTTLDLTVAMGLNCSVAGAVGFNGMPVSGSVGLPANTGACPAGGVGTAAGGWDTAGHRDTAIALITQLSSDMNAVKTLLKTFGLGA